MAPYRTPRKSAHNILDSRWVLKWKLKEGAKLIQARLTARGYKDRQVDSISTYSGTTTRWGQKLLLVVLMQMGWELWTYLFTLFHTLVSYLVLMGAI